MLGFALLLLHTVNGRVAGHHGVNLNLVGVVIVWISDKDWVSWEPNVQCVWPGIVGNLELNLNRCDDGLQGASSSLW